jgi:transposase
MPPVDRLNPIRAASSESSCYLLEFMREFPDDEACLQHIWRERFAPDGENADCPRCETTRKFKRYATKDKRPAWYCQTCGFRIHPLKGTIFEKSSTSLQLWFYAMYLITSTRCGISAKHLERELGVTYKTAWRMFNKIRNQLMTQDDGQLSGEVEADESFIGGTPHDYPKLTRAEKLAKKAVVFAAVERKGRIRASVIPNSRADVVRGALYEFVLPASIIYTDEYIGYDSIELRKRYVHRRIAHHARIWVDGTTHTQTVEGFFGNFKSGLTGAHHSVSHKWLQGYLNEWTWRYNRRESETPMFRELIETAASRTV